MNLQEYCQQAIERAEARHAANGHDMFASFVWNGRRYVVSVMQHIVAECRTVREVRTFCMMHNRVF